MVMTHARAKKSRLKVSSKKLVWKQTDGRTDTTDRIALSSPLTANSHRHARHDKTVLSVSRPIRRCELDSRQLKTIADRKFEV